MVKNINFWPYNDCFLNVIADDLNTIKKFRNILIFVDKTKYMRNFTWKLPKTTNRKYHQYIQDWKW